MKYKTHTIALACALIFSLGIRSANSQDQKQSQPKVENKQDQANETGKQEKKTRPEPPGPDDPKAAKSTKAAPKKDSPKKSTPAKTKPAKSSPAKSTPAKSDNSKASKSSSQTAKTGNWYIRQSPQILKVLEPIAQSSKGTTVKVLANVKVRSKEEEAQVSFGTVVDAAGFIITKASQIQSRAKSLKIQINGKKVPAKVFGIHEASDLAMLKVEPAGLEIKPIQWQNQTPEVGYLLATPDANSKTLGFGVLSVASREERDTNGFMGVNLQDPTDKTKKGAIITTVMPKSPAQYAGLKVGDRIFAVNGKSVKDMSELIAQVKKHKAGETVKIKLVRNDNEVERSIKLGSRSALGVVRLNPQETIAGNKLSARRTGFERVIQHDTVLKPEHMGGPILDLDGRAIGVNIAKNGRVSTYALPLSVLLPAIADLKSGKLNPAVVHKPRIDELTALIKEKEKQLAESGLKKAVEEAEKELEKAKKAFDEAEKAYAKLQKELEEAGKKKFKADESHKDLHTEHNRKKRDLSQIEKEIEEFKKEKKDLENTFK